VRGKWFKMKQSFWKNIHGEARKMGAYIFYNNEIMEIQK
jgi:hypothetical protein